MSKGWRMVAEGKKAEILFLIEMKCVQASTMTSGLAEAIEVRAVEMSVSVRVFESILAAQFEQSGSRMVNPGA